MNLNNVCKDYFDFKKLTLVQGCFRVEYLDQVLAELCCLQNMAYPLDSYSKLNVIIPSMSTVELFDNQVTLVETSPSYYNIGNPYPTRGILMCATYPCVDLAGEQVADGDRNLILSITDKDGIISSMPMYMFYMVLNNAQSTGGDSLINKMTVFNPNLYEVTVNAILTMGSKSGVKAGGCTPMGIGPVTPFGPVNKKIYYPDLPIGPVGSVWSHHHFNQDFDPPHEDNCGGNC